MVCKVLPLHCAFRKISRQVGEAFSGTEIPDMCNWRSGTRSTYKRGAREREI